MIKTLTTFALTAAAAYAAGSLSAIVLPAQPSELRAWTLTDLGEAEALTSHHQLIGFACGADRLTMTAEEEDHFPAAGCDAIEPIVLVCPEDMQLPPEPVTAAECARYMGDGY